MKYYVRTTGERTLDDSYSQIEYELLLDKEHKPIESFMKQLPVDFLGFTEIGGVGEMIYTAVRFPASAKR